MQFYFLQRIFSRSNFISQQMHVHICLWDLEDIESEMREVE